MAAAGGLGSGRERMATALRLVALLLATIIAFAGIREILPDRARAPGLGPHRRPAPAMTAREAAASQQGQPTTAAEAREQLHRALAAITPQAKEWADLAEVGNLLLARARLTNSFDDYIAAGKAFDAAFGAARPGVGPHLDRAQWNFAVHRLSAMGPDLDAVDRYAIPDDADVAAVLGLRGDIAFYGGRYAEARVLYERSAARLPSVGADLRLANYHARMGAPETALAFLDQADSRITGPQQQLRAFIEMRRGVVDLNRGRWADAERRFGRADEIFPGYWAVEEQLARVRALRGAPDDALALFRRMADRDASPDAFDGLAGIYRARGEVGEAQSWAGRAGAEWDRRLALLPEAAMGHALDHTLAFGDPARALDLAQRNFALRPYGDAAAGLAAALLANQRPAEALAALEPTLRSGWASAEPHLLAAEANALLGRGRQAETERKAALAINPRCLDRNPGMTWLDQ